MSYINPFFSVNKMPPIQEHGYEDEYGYVDEGPGNWGGWGQSWPDDYGHQDAPYTQSSVRSPSFSNFDPYYPPRPNGYVWLFFPYKSLYLFA